MYLNDSGQLGLLTNLPARTLHVAGEARITDLTTDPPTRIVGADADGDLGEATLGFGLALSSSVLGVDTGDLATQSDLSGFFVLNGRSGGQIAYGGTTSGEDLTLRGNSDLPDGDIFMQDNGGDVVIGGAAVAANLRLMEPSGSGTNYTQFKAQAQAANVTYTLPPDDGDAGEQLQTNGSGSLTWEPSGHAPDVQIYNSNGTYNIPTGAKYIQAIIIGGGGGGGSGRKGATTEANTGGGGGGGGGYTNIEFSVSQLTATSLSITIGSAGAGGAAQSSSSTNGASGSDGSESSVFCDSYLIGSAGGGDGGSGGSTSASTGGSGSLTGDFLGTDGTGCGTSGSVASGTAQGQKSAQGGGGGGGIPTGAGTDRDGGYTGKWNYAQTTALAGGTAPGGDALNCGIDYVLDDEHIIGGPGGPGGASSISGGAGDGGSACYGGGGGGGGAALNGVGNSGAGGTGGKGVVIIIAKY